MDEGDDKRDRTERKELEPPPGLLSWTAAHRHIMKVHGVQLHEARQILGKACAEGRIRAEYRLVTTPGEWAVYDRFGRVISPATPPTTEHRLAGYNARDVWREFPPAPSLERATVPDGMKAKTKLKLPVAELKAELRRKCQTTQLKPSWPREAVELSKWARTTLPDWPAAANTIRLNRELQDEYRKLTGQQHG